MNIENRKRDKETAEIEQKLPTPLIERLKAISDRLIAGDEVLLAVSHTELQQHRTPGFASTELDLLNWEGVDDAKVEDEVEDLKLK